MSEQGSGASCVSTWAGAAVVWTFNLAGPVALRGPAPSPDPVPVAPQGQLYRVCAGGLLPVQLHPRPCRPFPQRSPAGGFHARVVPWSLLLVVLAGAMVGCGWAGGVIGTCPAGTFSTNGLSPCTMCPQGQFSAAGNTSCVACGVGQGCESGLYGQALCPTLDAWTLFNDTLGAEGACSCLLYVESPRRLWGDAVSACTALASGVHLLTSRQVGR